MLKDDFTAVCRVNRMAQSTEKNYWIFVKKYILFHNKKHPAEMGNEEIEQFIKHLATEKNLSFSSQNLAFNALVFLYKKVLKKRFKIKKDYRIKRPQTLPNVLSTEEVSSIINGFEGDLRLLTQIIYGCGLRKNEALSLRLNDIDVNRGSVNIRNAKGAKDRIIPLPHLLIEPVRGHITKIISLHKRDIERKFDGVILPDSIKNKNPNAAKELQWYYLFPAKDWIKGARLRYHIHSSTYDKALKKVLREQKINKRISAHCLRHSYATHLLEAGYSVPQIQEKLGHRNIKTTLIYTHLTEKIEKEYQSPIDAISTQPQTKIYRITG